MLGYVGLLAKQRRLWIEEREGRLTRREDTVGKHLGGNQLYLLLLFTMINT